MIGVFNHGDEHRPASDLNFAAISFSLKASQNGILFAMHGICLAISFWLLPGVASGQDIGVTQAGLLMRRQKACGMVFTVEGIRQTKIADADLQDRIKTRSFVEDELLIRLQPTVFQETFALRFDPSNATNPYLSKWSCQSPGIDDLEVTCPVLRERFLIVEDSNRLKVTYRGGVDTADDYKPESLARHFRAQSRVKGRSYLDSESQVVNPFFYVLTLDTRQLSLSTDPTGKLASNMAYPLKFDGTASVAGRACERFVGRADGASTIDFEVVCLPSPEFAVASASIRINGLLERQLTITEFDKFNDFIYPSKGSYETYEGHVESIPFIYSFRVVDVRPLLNVDIKNWWPEDSEGTYSYNLFTKSHLRTPFSTETEQAFSRMGKNILTSQPTGFRKFLIAVNFGALLIIAYVMARRRRLKQGIPATGEAQQ